VNVKQENLSLAEFFTIKSQRRWIYFLSLSTFLMLFSISDSLFAQNYGNIKGVITSEKGELLSGVTVQVKNTRLITQTNKEGEYILSKVPISSTITLSRLGFKNLQLDLVLIPDKDIIQNITLISDIQSLDEVHIQCIHLLANPRADFKPTTLNTR
jgi:hypothetical protein